MNSSEKEIATLSYENTQNWIRHYDTILTGISFFIASIVLGYVGLKLQAREVGTSDHLTQLDRMEAVEAFFPITLILIGVLLTLVIDRECRRGFTTIVRIERALGFYNRMDILDGEPLLPKYLQDSPKKSSVTCTASYALNAVLIPLVLTLLVVF